MAAAARGRVVAYPPSCSRSGRRRPAAFVAATFLGHSGRATSASTDPAACRLSSGAAEECTSSTAAARGRRLQHMALYFRRRRSGLACLPPLFTRTHAQRVFERDAAARRKSGQLRSDNKAPVPAAARPPASSRRALQRLFDWQTPPNRSSSGRTTMPRDYGHVSGG